MTDATPSPATPFPAIRISGLTQKFGTRTVFENISFEVAQGEVFVILGGSGCGKSTLLKLIIGLYKPSAGSIEVMGSELAKLSSAARRAHLRQMGVMFQSGALFGSLTLLQNVMLPLETFTSLSPDAREAVARTKLGLVGLADAADRKPAEISGGMMKRAGIARALALDPPLLFLDEPSAGLDPITAAGLDELILDLRRTVGATFVIVTHELQSILAIADRCIMLDKQARGIIAEGDPRVLRDTAEQPIVRAFFRREALTE